MCTDLQTIYISKKVVVAACVKEEVMWLVWCPNHDEIGTKESLHYKGSKPTARLHRWHQSWSKIMLKAAVLQCQHGDFEKLNTWEENKGWYHEICSVLMDIRSKVVVEAQPHPTKREGHAARVCLEKREFSDKWRGREKKIKSNEKCLYVWCDRELLKE